LPVMPPFENHRKEVRISGDGRRLFLLDFLGNEGELLELNRRW